MIDLQLYRLVVKLQSKNDGLLRVAGMNNNTIASLHMQIRNLTELRDKQAAKLVELQTVAPTQDLLDTIAYMNKTVAFLNEENKKLKQQNADLHDQIDHS